MKKAAQNNMKLDSFLTRRAQVPLARILNKPVLNDKPIIKRQKTEVNKKEKEHQIQISSDRTERMSEGSNKAKQRDYVCKQLILIGPSDVTYFQSMQKKLSQVKENYNKHNFVNFLKVSSKFHNLTNLRILQSISDEHFWNITLPKMLNYCTDHPKQKSISSSIQTLPQKQPNLIELSKAQVLMILINMFLCSLPWQSCRQYLSFATLMSVKEKDKQWTQKLKAQKLKCFINYFKIMMEEDYSKLCKQMLRIQRVHKLYDKKQLFTCQTQMSDVDIKQGLIQNYSGKAVMVDFANKNIGGGVLANGAVQEEILFCVFPQLVVTLCICEQLTDNEAIIVSNATKFNQYSGYSDTFKFEGNCQKKGDKQKYEPVIVAIDATDFSGKIGKGQSQYTSISIQRQIIKATVGFEGVEMLAPEGLAICTGRWGCGAFQGDAYLKFIIQWIACSTAGRKMIYLSQSEKEQQELLAMKKYLKRHRTNELVEAISEYSQNRKGRKGTFLQFLKQWIC